MIILTIIVNLISKVLISLLSKNYSIKILFFFNLLEILLVIFGVYEVVFNNVKMKIYLYTWLFTAEINIPFTIYIDTLSMILIMVVSFISVMVQTYSFSYMSSDPHLNRFMGLLNMFTMFMVLLVSFNNLTTIFIGWEGIGLVSYLLVNFWYTRTAANRSALMAYLVNRVGDLGILIGIIFCFYIFKTDSLNLLAVLFTKKYNFSVSLVAFFLIIGVIAKSSQLGLHTWLPHAMEGPTPVSALLHAATLVTAGVYLLLRISPIIESNSFILNFLAILGGLTAFIGGTLGLVANDLKRVIAFSTFSQLGYMVYCIGISAYGISLYHLTNHAFFKALLFLSAGSVIHGLSDEQDLRKMGGLVKMQPVTYIMMLAGSLSILGIPYTTGFYSKETILALGYSKQDYAALTGYCLCLSGALLTAIYSVRALVNTFIVAYSNSFDKLSKVHESNFLMVMPLVFLSFFSIFGGFIFSNIFSNFSSLYKYSPISTNEPGNFEFFGGGSIALFLTFFGIVLSLIANLFSYKIIKILEFSKYIHILFNLLSLRYYFDIFYSKVFTKIFLKLSYITSRELDKGLNEYLGPNGVYNFIYTYLYKLFSVNNSNLSPIYMSFLFIGFSYFSIFYLLYF